MLPDLKQRESVASGGRPEAVVVSAGSEEANREMELTSPVLLDQNFATGQASGQAPPQRCWWTRRARSPPVAGSPCGDGACRS